MWHECNGPRERGVIESVDAAFPAASADVPVEQLASGGAKATWREVERPPGGREHRAAPGAGSSGPAQETPVLAGGTCRAQAFLECRQPRIRWVGPSQIERQAAPRAGILDRLPEEQRHAPHRVCRRVRGTV